MKINFNDFLNIFRAKPEAKYILALFAGVLLAYELISQIFLPVPMKEFNEALFFRDILFWILIILGVIGYSMTLKFWIDYDKYWDIIDKISFEGGQIGTDALCCFLTNKDNAVPLPRKKDKLLICAALSREPEDEDDLRDVMEKNYVEIFTEGRSCINLEMDYKINDNNLILKFKCGDYDNRPEVCRDYPLSTGSPCRLSQYCHKPKEQVKFFGWSVVMFYAFEQKKFPELEKFSVGVAQSLFSKYFLIPVPFNNSKISNIFC